MSPGTKSVLIFYVGYRSSLSLFSRPFYSSRPGQKRIYTLDQANSDKVREYDIIRTRDIRFTTGDIDQAASIYLVKKKKKREIDSIVVYICSPLLSLFLSPSLCLLFAVFDYSRWLGTRDVSFMKLDKATSFLSFSLSTKLPRGVRLVYTPECKIQRRRDLDRFQTSFRTPIRLISRLGSFLRGLMRSRNSQLLVSQNSTISFRCLLA